MSEFDATKLNEFLGRILGDLGGAYSVAPVRASKGSGLSEVMLEGGFSAVRRASETLLNMILETRP